MDAVALLAAAPAEVLEVGCHCGPLLTRLTAAGYRARGVDINEDAVAAANEAGLIATVGAVPDVLDHYTDHRFDVIVASYCLAYLAPEDVPDTLASLLRITRYGLVLVEPMAGKGVTPGMHYLWQCPEWRHDYFEALDTAVALMVRAPQVTMTRFARGPYAGINGVVVARTMWPK